jgi:hypothetical protein
LENEENKMLVGKKIDNEFHLHKVVFIDYWWCLVMMMKLKVMLAT